MQNFVQSYHLDTYSSTELTNVTGWVTSYVPPLSRVASPLTPADPSASPLRAG
jgi:hypothetical protein